MDNMTAPLPLANSGNEDELKEDIAILLNDNERLKKKLKWLFMYILLAVIFLSSTAILGYYCFSLSNSLAHKEQEIAHMGKQNSDNVQQADSIKAQLDKANGHIAQLQSQVSQANSSRDQANKVVEEREKAIATLTNDNNDLSSQLDKTRKSAEGLSTELAREQEKGKENSVKVKVYEDFLNDEGYSQSDIDDFMDEQGKDYEP